MRLKLLKLTGTLLVLAAFTFVLLPGTPANAFPPEDPIVGTCCPGIGTCKIGNYEEENAFYWKNGPCPIQV